MKDFIRSVVLKTNDVWPFSSLNRLPYYACIRAFLQISKDFPRIQRVYLRHGLLDSDWVPGISDIDLTVLFEPGKSAEEEFTFATAFWRRVEHLKRFFPMLGEIDLIDSKQISSWTRFTIRGKESTSWKLLQGSGTLQVNDTETPAGNFINSFNHALLYYFNFFLRRFLTVQRNSIGVTELQRICQKVMRYAKADGCFEQGQDPAGMLCALMAGLDKRLETFVLPAGSPIPAQIATALKIPPPESKALAQALSPYHSIVQAIYPGEHRSVIVLDRPIDPRELEECIWVLKRQPIISSSAMHIVTFRTFDYLLRFYDPFFYTHLMQNRALAFGNDVFKQVAAPSIGAFIRCLLNQTVTILPFPTSRSFITCNDPKWYGEHEVDSWLERCLRLKLFLEHGLIPLIHSESVVQSRNYYQSDFNEYQKLTGNFSKSALFRLFRKLTLEVHSDLEQYAPDQDWLLQARAE